MKLYFLISGLLIVPGLIAVFMGGIKPNVEFLGGIDEDNRKGFLFENVDEKLADRLSFLLWVLDAGKRLEKDVGPIHMHQRDVVALAEERHYFLRSAKPHQSVIDQNASQLIADRFMDQNARHCGIDAA